MRYSVIKYLSIILILLAAIMSDQLSKQWAQRNLKDRPVKIIIKYALEFGYTENRGMVFGINNRSGNIVSKNFLLIIRILLSLGLLIYVVINLKKSILFLFPFLLILAGAVGNIIDSLRFGYVVDFIHMYLGNLLDWPFLYNLADAYVCIGMGILILQGFILDNKKKKTDNQVGLSCTAADSIDSVGK